MPEADTRKVAESRIGKYGECVTLKVDGTEPRVLLAGLANAPVGFSCQRGSSCQHFTIGKQEQGVRTRFDLGAGRQDFVLS